MLICNQQLARIRAKTRSNPHAHVVAADVTAAQTARALRAPFPPRRMRPDGPALLASLCTTNPSLTANTAAAGRLAA